MSLISFSLLSREKGLAYTVSTRCGIGEVCEVELILWIYDVCYIRGGACYLIPDPETDWSPRSTFLTAFWPY